MSFASVLTQVIQKEGVPSPSLRFNLGFLKDVHYLVALSQLFLFTNVFVLPLVSYDVL